MPAKLAPERTRGVIIACGDLPPAERATVLFSRLFACVGPLPRAVLLSAREPDDDDDAEPVAPLIAGALGELGAHALRQRADADRRELLDRIEHLDLVVLTGSQPLRLSTLIGGTALARLLRRRNAEGMAIAGIGAAAAVLCEHMLAGGIDGPTPRVGGATLAPGLGLTNRMIIDQGGHASRRVGRLLSALALNPFALGLGLDPGAAVAVGPDNVLDVIGGGATMIDPSGIDTQAVPDLTPGASIRIADLRVHALGGGTRYDLDFRREVG